MIKMSFLLTILAIGSAVESFVFLIF